LGKFIRYVLAFLLTAFALGTIYLWVIFVSPIGYSAPDNLPTIEENEIHQVFVYGTLTKTWVRYLVMGRTGDSRAAKLPGFRKDKLNIKPDADAFIDGQIISVNAQELRALDRYERLGVRYERVKLTMQNGESAWVYRLIRPHLR
jgi:gamma-glutamylcyclotransferase (GGCT)/AIG2-like uncharacterized protein YtfP